jgi:uncharacterized protein (DUF427 family)
MRGNSAVNDYPAAMTAVNHVEPVPRPIRAFLAGVKVLDTTAARYVWEWPYYPQYYIPVADVRRDLLIPEGHTQQSRRGTFEAHALRAGRVQRPGAARLLTDSPVPGLAGTVRFDWAALDAWFEEDEQVFVHPRNPYVRVDALRSTRPVRVELDGVVLAESPAPVMVFETGLPTRYYINSTEINFEPSDPQRHRHQLPVQRHDQPVLVGPCQRHGAPRSGVGLRLPDPPAPAHRRTGGLLQRKGALRHEAWGGALLRVA